MANMKKTKSIKSKSAGSKKRKYSSNNMIGTKRKNTKKTTYKKRNTKKVTKTMKRK
jgi:hypothetical protein